MEIADGTSENMVAKAVVVALRAQPTGERFSAERDDGEDVLIKKTYGQPDFTVAVVSNTVEGVRIRVQRESSAPDDPLLRKAPLVRGRADRRGDREPRAGGPRFAQRIVGKS